MILLDADKRKVLRDLKAQVKELERPEREAAKIKRATARAKREKALVRSKGQREPRVKDKAYLAWIRRLPCAVADHECSGPIEAAHLRFSDFAAGRANPGMQAKPDDAWSSPLCRHHHQCDQHKRSERTFWASRGIDASQLCRDLRAAYPDHDAGVRAIESLKPNHSRGFEPSRRGDRS